MTDAQNPTDRATGHEAGGLMQFDMAGRLFIWGFRVTAHARRLGSAITRDLQQVYGQFNVADAACSLEAMLEVFACTAHAPIELHATGCPCVSSGECRLLQAVAAAQHGELDLARQRFEHWLPPLAADWIMTPAHGFGRCFAMGGLLLPLRDAEPQPRQTTLTMRSWQVGSPTLH